jgi:CBS domain-containing protein
VGEEVQRTHSDVDEQQRFMRSLLNDLGALEVMLAEGLIESELTRIGAEQEVFLVDRSWRPALLSAEVLSQLHDERFTTELGRFNLELNLSPVPFTASCFRDMNVELVELIETAERAAREHGAEILLCGILPTLLKSDLSLEAMTPSNRYYRLNEAMRQLRGADFEFRIKGRDELIVRHDNVMFEACNASFQVHLQVPAEGFVEQYNVAQLLAAPVLAAAVNSPLLLGRRLWAETRIALFQQSVDTRRPGLMEHRRQPSRVSFGSRWLQGSAVEIFKEDIARFRPVLGTKIEGSSLAVLQSGGIPTLRALRLHNGTIYRWNRVCYGLTEGKPHLRIENRLFPSGPSVPDEIANAVFWLGLMSGAPGEYGDPAERVAFEVVKENFVAAARLGLRAQLTWLDGVERPVSRLILDELLPVASKGLADRGVDESDIRHYLSIIERRVAKLRTGAWWQVVSLDALQSRWPSSEALAALVASMHEQQESGKPVDSWEAPSLDPSQATSHHYQTVGQLMTTDLFTIGEDETVDLAAHIMDWRHVRHVPVEDEDHRLVGLVTHRMLLRLMSRALTEGGEQTVVPVRQVMERELITVTASTGTLEALRTMQRHGVSCLPVVDDQYRLVGIISERDLMGISWRLLENFLADS